MLQLTFQTLLPTCNLGKIFILVTGSRVCADSSPNPIMIDFKVAGSRITSMCHSKFMVSSRDYRIKDKYTNGFEVL